MNKGLIIALLMVCFSLLVSAAPETCHPIDPDPNDDVFPVDDNHPPRIHSVSVSPNSVTPGRSVTIEVSASDGLHWVSKIYATINGETVRLSEDSDGIWRKTIDAPSAVGSYPITVEAWDVCHNGPRVDDGTKLKVYSGGGGDDDDKRFDIEIDAGCAKEPVTVTVTRGARGVEDAIVKLYYEGDRIDKDVTDDDGEASVIPPYEGDYELEVSCSGYRTETESFSIRCTAEEEEGEDGGTSPENVTPNVAWLPVEEQLFYAGAKNIVTATIQNTGDGKAYNILLSVEDCPSGWECGITPSVGVLEPQKTSDVSAWFTVPDDENETEQEISLSLKVGEDKDDVSFKASVRIKEKVDEDEAKAYEAINKARADLEKAQREGKNVSEALSIFMEAQNGFTGGDYDEALAFSRLVTAQLAMGEKEGEETASQTGGELVPIAAAIVLLVVGGAIIFYLTRKGEQPPHETVEHETGEHEAEDIEGIKIEEINEEVRKGLGKRKGKR